MQKIFFILFIALTTFAKTVTYKVDGNEYEGYLINKGSKAPVVFMIHDWDGVGEYEVKRAQMLSKLGYTVFAADIYGKGVRPQSIEDKKKMTASLYSDRVKMRKLLNGSLDFLKSQKVNSNKIIALGYCFGGTSILELARSGVNLTAYVSFHGGLDIPEGQSYKDVKSTMAIFHGSADTAVSMDDFANLAKHFESNNVKHEMITYSGAPHAFSVFGSDRYREDADKKSWKRFTEMLKEL